MSTKFSLHLPGRLLVSLLLRRLSVPLRRRRLAVTLLLRRLLAIPLLRRRLLLAIALLRRRLLLLLAIALLVAPGAVRGTGRRRLLLPRLSGRAAVLGHVVAPGPAGDRPYHGDDSDDDQIDDEPDRRVVIVVYVRDSHLPHYSPWNRERPGRRLTWRLGPPPMRAGSPDKPFSLPVRRAWYAVAVISRT
jgi:hypothetical protein